MGENLLNALTVVGTLVFIVLIFVGAHFAAKFVGRRYNGGFRTGVRTGKMKVLDQLPLGPDRQIVIVRVAEKPLLIGVTSERVELLKELDSADFPPEEEMEKPEVSFSSAFHNALGQWGFNGGNKQGRKGGNGK